MVTLEVPQPPPLNPTNRSAPELCAEADGHDHIAVVITIPQGDDIELPSAYAPSQQDQEAAPTTAVLAPGPTIVKSSLDNSNLSAPSLQSLGIKVEYQGHIAAVQARQGQVAPVVAGRSSLGPYPRSAPAVQQFQSPMRQHKRTPSQYREVKETLNARSAYTIDDVNGPFHHTINQYTIMEEIGRGSYGAVHRAVDQFGNEYAVKEFSKTRLRKRAQSNILRRGPRAHPAARRLPYRPGIDPIVSDRLSNQKAEEDKDALFLIREEIAIMKKLNHPNLVSLIEVLDDPDEDSLYVVLEICKKGVIMKVGLEEQAIPYREEECRCWFRDLILGIEYLHNQGVVHRDIKPDNLLLTDEDVLKIVDFGVSEMFEKPEQMRTAKSAGSPAFLPPELCVAKHGDVSGTAADIWSMGVSLYCLRYGHIPFNRPGVLEMYVAIAKETPELPEDENPFFRDLILRLMEKDPEQRITMPEIRKHPWVTKQGEDPLLSSEENCSDPVEPPNELEVSHAFTRRMTHLLCVMKAISNFKALLPSRSRTANSRISPLFEDAAAASRPCHKLSVKEAEMAELKRQNNAHAARLLEERMLVLQTRGSNQRGEPVLHKDKATPRNSSIESATHTLPVLGIGIGTCTGTGAGAGSCPDEDDMGIVVAESPTAADFDIYDAAYEAEIERIRKTEEANLSSSSGSGIGSSSAANVYMTRHLGKTRERVRDKLESVTDLLGGEDNAAGGEWSKSDKVKEMFQVNHFAELVAQTIRDARMKKFLAEGKSRIHDDDVVVLEEEEDDEDEHERAS